MLLRLPLLLALQIGASAAPPAPQAPVRATQILASPDNGLQITVSVLDPQEAQSLFTELAERRDIPHGFLPDGSFARAHKMVRLLDDRNVTAAKAWVLGELFVDSQRFGEVGLTYHVAPAVFLREGRSTALYVLDPSLFDKPVPHAAWKAKLLAKPKAKLERAYFTTRFAYDPRDRAKAMSGYEEEALRDMNATNRECSRNLFMFDHAKGSQRP